MAQGQGGQHGASSCNMQGHGWGEGAPHPGGRTTLPSHLTVKPDHVLGNGGIDYAAARKAGGNAGELHLL